MTTASPEAPQGLVRGIVFQMVSVSFFLDIFILYMYIYITLHL